MLLSRRELAATTPGSAAFRRDAWLAGPKWAFRLCALVVAFGMLGAVACSVHAQDVPAPEEPKLVELDSVVPIENPKEKGKWSVKLIAKAPRLPAGTEVEFFVRRSHSELGSFKVVLDGSKRVSDTFELDFIEGYVASVSLKAFVYFERQSREVQAQLQKQPDDFPIAGNPWFQNFQAKPFDLGSEKDLARQKEETKEYFRKTMVELAKLHAKFSMEFDKAESKSDYTKGESLDTEKWRKLVDEDVRKPLIKIQQGISDQERKTAFATSNQNKRDLRYLKDLSAAIGKITVRDSKQLYENFGLSLALEDAAIAGMNLNFNVSSPQGRHLNALVIRLCDSQGIDKDTLK